MDLVEDLKEKMSNCRELATDLGIAILDLNEKELYRFALMYERVYNCNEMFLRRIDEALLGAMIAKKQMIPAMFGGDFPGRTEFGGPFTTRACWLGINNYYGADGFWKSGMPQYWIHSGTDILSGDPGEHITISKNIVHVIYGVQSYTEPKVESLELVVDGVSKVVIEPCWKADYIAEFSAALIFKEGTTVFGRIIMNRAFGDNCTSFLNLYGVSYIKAEGITLSPYDSAKFAISLPREL